MAFTFRQFGQGFVTVRATTSSITANAGDLVSATATAVITLPSPVLDTLVGVRAGIAITGASPVTVQASGGAGIFGTGLSAVSNFSLAGGACVVLQADGTNWLAIAGQPDTGWIPLTLTTGVVAGNGWTPSARLQGDIVRLKGMLSNSSGGNILDWATIPAVCRPTAVLTVPAVRGDNNAFFPLHIYSASGFIEVMTATPGGIACLDGITYSLS